MAEVCLPFPKNTVIERIGRDCFRIHTLHEAAM
jgi:hypothetical protein